MLTRENHARLTSVVVALAVMTLAGCGGGGSDAPASNPPTTPPPPATVGLDSKPANLTCVAPDRPQSSAITITDAFPNLPSISQPVKVLVEPVADPRWFVLRKTGQLVVFDPDNATSVQTFLDLSNGYNLNTGSESGLLGMAFHPDYPTVPEVFLSYVRNHSSPSRRSVIRRFILDDIDSPGAGTVEEVVIEIDQDFGNHNGGDIAFGADRLLYIGLGDGGSGGDPNERSQDNTHLLGAMLRIDVIGTGADYNIPGSNPFSQFQKCGPGEGNTTNCPEIYAWGFRNPWRWSFDPPTGELWMGDVGQNAWEEINIVELGENYGWDCREGAHDFEPNGCASGLVDPVAEYNHANGNVSITGGYVYRGTEVTGLIGRYVFGDFASGRIWALQGDRVSGYTLEELVNTSTGPSSFGVDQDGELYFTDYGGGRIMRIGAAGGGQDNVANLLSDSGCVDPADITQPYSGLVPYDINAPFWSDDAVKDRYMAIPDGSSISINGDDDWVFPPGTVLVKDFRLNGDLIETRHLMRHPDGVWAGYTYEWNAAQTEATRVRGGKSVDINGQTWIYPDEAECLRCHTNIATVALGPETAQLNKDFTYPSTSRTANQLETLDHIMMFSSPLPDVGTLPALPDPADTSVDIDDRARSYLHTNCASCHQPGGPTPVNLDLRYTTALADTNACNVEPEAGDADMVNDPLIIAVGNAARSVLVERMNLRNQFGMPPLGSTIADSEGVTLVTDWVNGLANCN